MYNAVLTLDDIQISLNLDKHRSVCLSQQVAARPEGPSGPAMDRKIDIPPSDHGSSNSDTFFRRSSGTNQTAHFGPISSPNILFPPLPPTPIGVEGVSPNVSLYLTLRPLFETQAWPPRCHLVSIAPVFKFGSRSMPLFQKTWLISPIVCWTLYWWCCYSKLDVFTTLRNELFGFLLY